MAGIRINFRPIDFARRNGLGHAAFYLKDGSKVWTLTNKSGFTYLWEINKEGKLVAADAASRGVKLASKLEKYHDRVNCPSDIYFAVSASSMNILA
jgi:hypothetical protein